MVEQGKGREASTPLSNLETLMPLKTAAWPVSATLPKRGGRLRRHRSSRGMHIPTTRLSYTVMPQQPSALVQAR
eukprot:13368734-Alexandrium_andersonii.AAC.1